MYIFETVDIGGQCVCINRLMSARRSILCRQRVTSEKLHAEISRLRTENAEKDHKARYVSCALMLSE